MVVSWGHFELQGSNSEGRGGGWTLNYGIYSVIIYSIHNIFSRGVFIVSFVLSFVSAGILHQIV